MFKGLSEYITKIIRGEKVQINGQEAQWKKVDQLVPGMKIAVADINSKPETLNPKHQILNKSKCSKSQIQNSLENSNFKFRNCLEFRDSNLEFEAEDVKFEEIVSIEHVGRERVWDIEVEGTHNFVGNGIIAHNTYISSNLMAGGITGAAYNAMSDSGTATYAASDDDLYVEDILEVGNTLYVNGSQIANYWQRNGTNLAPLNIGDSVGIGTTSPGAELDVVGDIRGNRFVDRNATSYFVDPGNTGTAGAFSGNVGIGTTAPTIELQIVKDVLNDYSSGTTTEEYGLPEGTLLYLKDTSTDEVANKFVGIGFSGEGPGGARRSAHIGGVTGSSGHQMHIVFGQKSSNTAFVERMRIDTSGNVGIGTTSPGAKLEIASGTGYEIKFSGAFPANVYQGESGKDMYITTNTGKLYLGTVAAGQHLTINAGNVGIGTTAPSEILELYTASGTDTYLEFDNAANTDAGGIKFKTGNALRSSITQPSSSTYMEFRSDDAGGRDAGFAFYNDAHSETTPLLYLHKNGNVGIGTAAPSFNLDVEGAGSAEIGVKATTGRADIYIDRFAANKQALVHFQTNGSDSWLIGTPDNDLYSGDGTDFIIGTTNDPDVAAMVIDTNGNIGIGMAAPGAELEVAGEILAGNGAVGTPSYSFSSETNAGMYWSSTQINFAQNGYLVAYFDRVGTVDTRFAVNQYSTGATADNYPAYTFTSDLNTGLTLYGADQLSLTTGGATRVLVDASGNVGIGDASPNTPLTIKAASTADQALYQSWRYSAGSDVYTLKLKQTVTSGVVRYTFDMINNSTTYSNVLTLDRGNVGIGTAAPAYQLQLSTNSAAKPTSNVWTVASDERVKANINNFEDGLETLMNLRPITYQYNGLGGFIADGKTNIGFIAQELQPITPYMVGSFNNKLNPDDEEETELLNYDGHALPFILVNAVQEQQLQIEGLKQKTAANSQVVLDLSQAGDLAITGQADNPVVENQATGEVIDKVVAGAAGVFARLDAGLSQAAKLVTDTIETRQLTAENKIISPVIETTEIKMANNDLRITNNEGTVIKIDKEGGENKVSVFGKLVVDGEAEFSGNVSIGQLEAETIEAEEITAQEATFGSIYADEIISPQGSFGDLIADKISAVRAELQELVAAEELDTATGTSLLGLAEEWSVEPPESEVAGDGGFTSEIIIAANLLVQGRITLDNLIVNQQLLVGNLVFSENGLISLDNNLYLQPTGIGKIDFLAGILIVEDNGSVTINGDLTVSGAIAAAEYQGTDGNFVVSLGESGFGQLLVKGENDQIVSSIDASGSATFAKLNIANPILASESDQAATASAQIATNASAGVHQLPTGELEVQITTDQLTENSLVYITPVSDTQNQVLYVKEKYIPAPEHSGNVNSHIPGVSHGESAYFTVALNEELENPVEFNWWIIN